MFYHVVLILLYGDLESYERRLQIKCITIITISIIIEFMGVTRLTDK